MFKVTANGVTVEYPTLEAASATAQRIFEETGVIVGIEEGEANNAVDPGIFREDMLAEVVVEEPVINPALVTDALTEARQVAFYLADLVGAAHTAADGEMRDELSETLSETLNVMCSVGDALRRSRAVPR